jgi:hypothetical protein
MVTEGNRPLPDRRPNPAMDRLEAKPMVIRGPHLDRSAGCLATLFGDRVGEFFLAASSAALAACGFQGRGDWIDQPIALSASHPRCTPTLARPSSPAIQCATLPLVRKPPSGGGL